MKLLKGFYITIILLTYAFSSSSQSLSATAEGLRRSVPNGNNHALYFRLSNDLAPASWFGSQGNISYGLYSMYSSPTGTDNIGLGATALLALTTGNYNVGIGVYTLYYAVTGSNNAAVGQQATCFITSGSDNCDIGAYANNYTKVSNSSTSMGYNAGSYTSTSNCISIGANAFSGYSNKIVLGSSISSLECQVPLSVTSDARFKYAFNDNVPGLSFLMSLRPKTYRLDLAKLALHKNESLNKENSPLINDTTIHAGFLAQDVEKVADSINYSFDGVVKPSNSRDNYSLSYSQFVVPLVKGIQEQQKKIEHLKNRNKYLEQRINEEGLQMSLEITALKKMLIHLKEKVVLNQNKVNSAR